jgi:hypothetical protein
MHALNPPSFRLIPHHRTPLPKRALCLTLACVFVLVTSSMLADFRSAPGSAVAENPPAAAPEFQWKRFGKVSVAPAVLESLRGLGFSFRYATLPVVRIDGDELQGQLPPAIWVKLEQPGNVVLLLETESGVFVKNLEDVSPGFVSRCRLDAYSFGTTEGKPAEIDVRTAKVKSLWVLQDAELGAVETPGYIALTPPTEIPGDLPTLAALRVE